MTGGSMEGKQQVPMDMIAKLDQAMAAVSNMAIMLGDYRRKLRQEGFTDEQAMSLVIEFQQAILSNEKK
jgi:hypothetical protein